MVEAENVREGMRVRTADGREVGRVTGIGDIHFEMEPPGILTLPRRDYLVEYSDVDFVTGDDVYLTNADHPLLTLEEDDDGGALPPRHCEGMDAEPVNRLDTALEPGHP
ncbi:PRC-barrel domain-containing protein [Pyxidicoccus sp. 3LG]